MMTNQTDSSRVISSSSKFAFLFLLLGITVFTSLHAQGLKSVVLEHQPGLRIKEFKTTSHTLPAPARLPFFSIRVNDKMVQSSEAQPGSDKNERAFLFPSGLRALLQQTGSIDRGWKATVVFKNQSDSVITLENMVPFGVHRDHIYITASGPWSLARTNLYRPGKSPVGVILPDNAWEMGYGAISLDDSLSAVAIARRTASKQAKLGRWKSTLKPGGSVTYTFYADLYQGSWQNGLRLMFRDRWLYDLEHFDDSLYRRKDLSWIRDKYLIALQMAWDQQLYDREKGQYTLDHYLADADTLLGGWGIYGIWPTWPRLGLDQRNQWDLYRDLPGGLSGLNKLAQTARSHNTRFFIEYNPWDQSTRSENPYKGMASLIDKIGADGVVLDTRGSSSYELQSAADSVRKGVIMYSEGMAVPKDMPGIISGRVHNAIKMPPPLNLNKLIKPDFAIFRVGDAGDGRLRRGIGLSLFNGYGYEFNLFGPERPSWLRGAMRYAGEVARVLRQNSTNFHNHDWTPLIDVSADSIWVNKWPGKHKTVYTIFSLKPGGFEGYLFDAPNDHGHHYVDLWNHTEIQPDHSGDSLRIPVQIDAFNRSWLDTRREGSVGAIAALPELLHTSNWVDSLYVDADSGSTIRIWAGNPSYGKKSIDLPSGSHTVNLTDRFGMFDGKFVIQLFDRQNELLDERIETIEPGSARLVARPRKSQPVAQIPEGMVKIPGGKVDLRLTNRETFIAYPDTLYYTNRNVSSFYIDRYPVTNADYKQFIEATGYQPDDTTNYLKNWVDGTYPKGTANHPVVWVSLEDARQYARWAGKRLPTELEWQRAAQGDHNYKWPWGADFDSTRCNVGLDHATPVDAHPNGSSEYGVEDLVGNVWQLTGDVYRSEAYEYVMIRGGSYYKPTSSWWYVEGGPEPLNKHQMLLRVAPGFDRSATVGFRLAKDAK